MWFLSIKLILHEFHPQQNTARNSISVMETVQRLQHSSMSTASSFPSDSPSGFDEKSGFNEKSSFPNQFPAGLRVLVVDDDPICLKIIDKMLRRCLYEVTTCSRATVALSMLRERKGSFDLVISDVYMPDMDGFKLLEHVGLEMDLPVIMMSADGETSVVMKGIKHGACDYLLKPIRIEELKNIWQHVIRKKRNCGRELEHSGSAEDSEKNKKGSDDIEYASSVNEGIESNSKTPKRRKETKEEDDDFEQENDDPTSLKKPRVVWSVELHQQFVSSVNQLGIDKAVPKRILEMMNVHGLTRENVASHLQKYRLYLRRLSEVAQQQSGLNSSFGGTAEINLGSMSALGRLDLQAFAASGQTSPQTLVALQAGLLGKINAKNGLGMSGETFCLPMALQGVSSNSLNSLGFGQPLMKSQGGVLQGLPSGLKLKQLSQSQPNVSSYENGVFSMNDTSPGPSLLPQLPTAAVGQGDLDHIYGSDNNLGLNLHNNALMLKLLQQQQQQLHQTPAPLPHQSGAQLHGQQVLNLPSSNLLGQRTLSNTLSTLGNANSSQGNSLIGPGSAQINLITPEEHACNAYFGIQRMEDVNHSLNSMPVNSVFQLRTVVASTPLSTGAEGITSLPGMKSPRETSEVFNSQPLRSSGVNCDSLNGFAPSLIQGNIQGCQVPKAAFNQGLGPIAVPTLNPHYSQTSSGFQGLNFSGIQDHVLSQSLGFSGKGSNLPNRLTSNAGHLRTVSNTPCQSDQSRADSGTRLKGRVSDLMEGTRLAEGEFSMDGYN